MPNFFLFFSEEEKNLITLGEWDVDDGNIGKKFFRGAV